MGRLTLNILLFAHPEREVTFERIRDKVAPPAQGHVDGRRPALRLPGGNRKLLVDETAAAHVLDLRPLPRDRLVHRTGGGGETRHPHAARQSIDKKYIYRMLSNRAYIGEVSAGATAIRRAR